MRVKIMIKGEVELDTAEDIKLMREAGPEAALATLRAHAANVEVNVEVPKVKLPDTDKE